MSEYVDTDDWNVVMCVRKATRTGDDGKEQQGLEVAVNHDDDMPNDELFILLGRALEVVGGQMGLKIALFTPDELHAATCPAPVNPFGVPVDPRGGGRAGR